MTHTTEQFRDISQSQVATLKELSSQLQGSVEKLTELNLTTSRAAVVDSFSHVESILRASDTAEIVSLNNELTKSVVAKSTGYAQQLSTLLAATAAEFSRALGDHSAEWQAAYAKTLEGFQKNVPAGTEAVVLAFKNVAATGQNIIDATQNSARKAVALAGASLTPAAHLEEEVADKAARKKVA